MNNFNRVTNANDLMKSQAADVIDHYHEVVVSFSPDARKALKGFFDDVNFIYQKSHDAMSSSLRMDRLKSAERKLKAAARAMKIELQELE